MEAIENCVKLLTLFQSKIIFDMKKLSYPLLVLALFVAFGFVYKNYERKKNDIPKLLERPKAQAISMQSEWLNTKQAMETLLDQLRRHPENLKTKMKLAMAYIQESRVTGNHTYYDEAALKLVAQVLALEPQNYDGLAAKTTILLSQHHFSDALKTAQEFIAIYPDAAFGYGLLCDANIELGNYTEGVAAADKMASIRPDLRSYSRVSYLREIYGDFAGAKQAMALAVKSGMTGLEQTEWCRSELGKLYEITGDTSMAAQLYEQSLALRPDYAYALAGLGRLAKLGGRYTEGVAYFKKAAEQTMDYTFQDELTDCLQKINPTKARQNAENVIAQLKKHATDDTAEPDKGHYADKELAYAYLKIGDIDNALIHATREWNRRPENIDVNECLAWVYFQKNDAPNAAKFIEKALKTNSQNPKLLYRAGQIFVKNGDTARGNTMINKALSINKFVAS
jgi:tetratricopeptide (TPR) repeat protein